MLKNNQRNEKVCMNNMRTGPLRFSLCE